MTYRRPIITAPILLTTEEETLTVEGLLPTVLSAFGQAVREELYRAKVDDYDTLAIKSVIRAQLRLGDEGLIHRQNGAPDA